VNPTRRAPRPGRESGWSNTERRETVPAGVALVGRQDVSWSGRQLGRAMASNVPSPPPEVSPRARRLATVVLGPIERVLHVEAASGVALLIATAVALTWANSRWGASYEHLWHTTVAFEVGSWRVAQSLHFVINDVLMTLFFFVVGLEIRREMNGGELADLRRAALPIAAAFGGMIVPAGIFLALLPPPEVQHGWGVPMATDIAFAVGVLALLGKRVPPGLRVLLLALAIIDDIGAILVIAVFYSGDMNPAGFVAAGAGIASVLVLQRIGVRRALLYVPSGVIVWLGLLTAGVHPTLAGVAMGLLTPAVAWFGPDGLVSAAHRAIDGVSHQPAADVMQHTLDDLGRARREALAPALRLQALLHPWVAFLIMPVFALANAGVVVRADVLGDPLARAAMIGVAVGLVVGKPLGILAACFAAVRVGLCKLPRGMSWRGVTLVGIVAGIGFTMSIFIAGLAFASPKLLGAAKLGVLVASGTAALAGLAFGFVTLRGAPAIGARTASEAEASTED